MSKKKMLLATVVTSMALFALPSTVSAAEIHFEGATGVEFTGHGPASAPTAKNEPTITCETGHVQGVFTSETTGVVHGDITGCHINVLGFTIKCRTAGSALDNTITGQGTFHLITTTDGPAMLATPEAMTFTCAGTTITAGGSLITTITSPKCGESSKQATGVSSTTNGIQTHKTYTGKEYYPTARTEGSETVLETGINATATITFTKELKLVCT